ncbi:hypothetical protein Cylst_1209 [Cylindrospermum stagnale PCC 7417]|uniref:Uncharacterized protein n=1 Tax=Cylindrospermum stagnale PCC 7417 TaxID=56107 RepID=K9WUM9_9NOST|nr:hypothetical protein [Cylindrospermum stagnale]AFZ23509.1 hypothetical protein Cylst_1209 [Cylindrospermum stagnale PCC 7417]
MKLVKLGFVVFGSMSLLLLSACNNSEPTVNSSIPANTTSKPVPQPVTKTDHSKPNKGGQVVEAGKYHLEFVPDQESEGTHLDFYLLSSDNHASVPNAKVTAQIQTPNGSKKTLNLVYDADDEHYEALLPELASGEYQVVILSEIKGEKVNGRFSFKR